MHGLIIREEPIKEILAGRKIWEIRGSSTKIRGTISLIQSGLGVIVGVCELVDCVGPLSLVDLQQEVDKHRIPKEQLINKLPYSRTFAWVLKDAKHFNQPIPYKHPLGAIRWVILPDNIFHKE